MFRPTQRPSSGSTISSYMRLIYSMELSCQSRIAGNCWTLRWPPSRPKHVVLLTTILQIINLLCFWLPYTVPYVTHTTGMPHIKTKPVYLKFMYILYFLKRINSVLHVFMYKQLESFQKRWNRKLKEEALDRTLWRTHFGRVPYLLAQFAHFFSYFGRWKIGVLNMRIFLCRSWSGFYSSIIENTVRFVNILL